MPNLFPSQIGDNPIDLRFALGLLVVANIACSINASLQARGLYSDGSAYLVAVYKDNWFVFPSQSRAMVDSVRQWPIVLLSRYTSATVFQCGQVFTFVMLMLPPALSATCWLIAPENEKSWTLFPIASIPIGFAATSMNAIGEAAIAVSYYWILLFTLLFKTRSKQGQLLFLLACVPAFWAHEGTFPLTIGLLLTLALFSDLHQRRLFVASSSLLLSAILTYQIVSVLVPRYPEDRSDLLQGLMQFKFLYFEQHFNLAYMTGLAALLTIFAAWTVILTSGTAVHRRVKKIALGWLVFASGAAACSIFVERSFSPFAQESARYHPVIISGALGASMILLLKYRVDLSRALPIATVVLCSLCITQAIADLVATHRWNAYVDDLRSRLASNQGVVPWETTLHTGDEIADANWQLFKKGWVVPYHSIVFAPNGVVKSIIGLPPDTTFRPIDPERSNKLPELRGVDYRPYRGSAR